MLARNNNVFLIPLILLRIKKELVGESRFSKAISSTASIKDIKALSSAFKGFNSIRKIS